MTLTPREQLRMVNRTNSGSVRITFIPTSPSFLFASAIGRAEWPLLQAKARVRSLFFHLPQPTSGLPSPWRTQGGEKAARLRNRILKGIDCQATHQALNLNPWSTDLSDKRVM